MKASEWAGYKRGIAEGMLLELKDILYLPAANADHQFGNRPAAGRGNLCARHTGNFTENLES